MLLAAGSALVAAIGASVAAWSIFEGLNQERATARLDRAAEVVHDEYENLIDDARIIVGLYAERATLRSQLAAGDQAGIAEALGAATSLRAIHFLQVADASGHVLARVEVGEPPSAGGSVADSPSFRHALAGEPVDGLERDENSRLALIVSRPVVLHSGVVGVVQGGVYLDQRFVDRLMLVTGADVTLYAGEIPFASTVPERREQRAPAVAVREVLNGDTQTQHPVELREGTRRVRYYPLLGPDSRVVGMYSVGLRASILESLRWETLRYFLPLVLGIVVLAGLAAALLARHLTHPLRQLVGEAQRIGAGDLQSPVAVAAQPDGAAPSEIRALGRAMEEMRVRLRALNHSREEYLFAVAHELKTPLAALAASAEVIAEDDAAMPSDERSRTIARIRRSIARVQNLVDNLLDLGSLRAGTFRVKPRPVSLWGPINDAIASVEPMLLEKRQPVISDLRPDAVRVLADGRRIGQVFVNLLSNASKYGTPGVPIQVSAVRENGHVRVGVADQGPGIPLGERSTIFDRYYRSITQAEKPGVGLGLAIVKAIVEAHGGEVGISDGEGKGMTVWFTLPAAPEVDTD